MRILLYDGPIITMEDKLYCEAVVIEDEIILFAGDLDEAEEKYPCCEKKDLKGQTLVPGFIDTHCHLSFSGEMRTQTSFFEESKIENMLKKIVQETKKVKSGDAIFINGYEGVPLEEGRHITKEEMDEAAPNNPLFLMTAGTHATFVNSLALDMVLKLGKDEGIEVGPEDRKAGLLRDRANLFAFALAPKLMSREQKKVVRDNIVQECISNGITAAHTLEGRSKRQDIDVLTLLKDEEKLPFHLRIYYQTTEVDEVQKLGLKQIGGCFQCILDGDVDPGTAAFREPYINDPNNYGNLYFKAEDLKDFFMAAHKAGLQICMHAIGDAAIEQALDAYEAILKELPKEDHRHRIEHFEISAPDLIKRAKELGVVLAMQPVFDYYWPYESYVPYIGEERAKMRCDLRQVLDNGIIVGGGSDAPVTSMNPMLGIHAAVNHSVETSRISVLEALRMYTVDAAYLGFEEEERGTIRPGKEASFVVLSEDPLKADPKHLDQIQIMETIYKGKSVWEK